MKFLCYDDDLNYIKIVEISNKVLNSNFIIPYANYLQLSKKLQNQLIKEVKKLK